MNQTGNRNLFRNAKRGSGVSRFAHSKPPPHAAGVGTSGWWGWMEGCSFCFRGVRDVSAGVWCSGFRVPGVGGERVSRSGCRWGKCFLKMLGFLDFAECWIFKCWDAGGL